MTDAEPTDGDSSASERGEATYWKAVLNGHTTFYRIVVHGEDGILKADYITEGGRHHETTVPDILLGSKAAEVFVRIKDVNETPFAHR